MSTSFESLGLREELLRAVTDAGYTQTTDIQALAIPPLLEGRDVLGQAQTGTGKTAAFTLPMLNKLDMSSGKAQAVILAPTRELAMQVANNVWLYGQHMNVRVVPIYGGQSYTRQQKRLEKGVDVIVGTPGRMLDLIQKGMMDISHVNYLVLDEADEMLKMGFIDDVESILNATPKTRQTALFSATLPETIRSLAKRYLTDPLTTQVAKSEMTVQQIEQCYLLVHSDSKIPALSRLLEVEHMQSALIFTRTRARATELCEALLQRGYNVDVISGDLLQDAREAVLRRFRNGDLPLLVATDVVARGVDIPDVSHVFNYDIPLDQEDYVHRIGRTGRAGRAGKSITLVAPEERRKMRMIEHFIQQRLNEIKLPKLEDIRVQRNARFLQKLEAILESGSMELGMETIAELQSAGYDMSEVAAAAIQIARATEQNRPIDHVRTLREETLQRGYDRDRRGGSSDRRGNGGDFRRERRDGDFRRDGGSSKWADNGDKPRRRTSTESEPGMVRLILNMGRNDGVKPGDIVGTIAANAGIPGKAIGAITIQAEMTYVDVQDQHVDRVLTKMQSDGRMKGKSVKLTRA